MFAVLGEIQFQVVGSPEKYDSVTGYGFAEQRVLESKPLLQWVGDDLERLSFELMWHASFTNPAEQYALMRATAAQHLALPLVFGDGDFRGFFVIESIKMKSQQLSATGAPISIRVALALKEWDAVTQLTLNASPAANFTPLGVTTASSASTASATPSSVPGASALIGIPSATGALAANLDADDVPAAVIVRSAAL